MKTKKKLLNEKLLLILLGLILILTGCATTDVKTVKVDSFCEGKFTSQSLTRHQYELIDELILMDRYRDLMVDDVNYRALNEREYQECLTEK